MFAFVVRRLFQLLLVVWGSVTVLFFLYFVLPEDPANVIAGGTNRSVPEQTVENIRERYGLDKPLLVQYAKYVGGVVTLDFGESYQDKVPVTTIIKERAPASIRLATWAIVIETVVGIGTGVISAVRRGSWADALSTLSAALAGSLPVFVMAYFVQQITGVFAFQHNWPDWAKLPVQGIGPNNWTMGVFPGPDQVQYIIQPALILAAVSTAIVARLARTTMLEVEKADYIRTARAKGIRERDITIKHGLRNALIPVVTFIGIDFGTLIGAAILTETVFNWPGLGSKIAQAARASDLPVLVGLSVVVIVIYALLNMIVDVLYARLDPRVKLGAASS